MAADHEMDAMNNAISWALFCSLLLVLVSLFTVVASVHLLLPGYRQMDFHVDVAL